MNRVVVRAFAEEDTRMRAAWAGDWCMTGDPCPRCGSTETLVTDVYLLRQHGKIRSAAVPAGRNKVYAMHCDGCGFTARKRGIPGRQPRRRGTANGPRL